MDNINNKKNSVAKALGFLVIVAIAGAGLVYLAQGKFEKNIEVRKGADAESVAGCMLSCEEMVAGWLEMNPDSPNYANQKEKIADKAQQCNGMNELAGFPFSKEEILTSCGLSASSCVRVSPEELHSGACTDSSFIAELGLPQCCAVETGPSPVIFCGAEEEWVVGIAAVPTCYVPRS